MLEDEGWEGSKQYFQPMVSNSRVRVTAPLAWEGLARNIRCQRVLVFLQRYPNAIFSILNG